MLDLVNLAPRCEVAGARLTSRAPSREPGEEDDDEDEEGFYSSDEDRNMEEGTELGEESPVSRITSPKTSRQSAVAHAHGASVSKETGEPLSPASEDAEDDDRRMTNMVKKRLEWDKRQWISGEYITQARNRAEEVSEAIAASERRRPALSR